ncbi:MAG: hypothetical protein IPF88_05975 [Candidatus Microthrix sp.]|nr:hypothetical protein [Candidatus Microthrix sp.]MBK6438134.1 hypothetical protein [Candidatus Microthrix sp.]
MPRSPDDAGNDGERVGTNRVNAEAAPTRPKRAAPIGAAMRRLVVITPIRAAKRNRKIVVPMISAVLSFSPKVRIAKSLAQLGTLSTTTLPTDNTGDCTEERTLRSAGDAGAAPAAIRRTEAPATGPPRWWRGPRSTPSASPTPAMPGVGKAESARKPDSWGVGLAGVTSLLRCHPRPRITIHV